MLEKIAYELRRSVRRKRLAICITREGQVEVRAPERVSLKAIESFVHQNQAWIARKQAELGSVERAQPICFEPGAVIPVRGLGHIIQIVTGPDRSLTICEKGEIRVPLRDPDHPDMKKKLARKIMLWLQGQALEVLQERSSYFADQMGVSFQEICLGCYRAKWGSCSHSGVLRYHWPLIMAPSKVLDYVVIHEVAHLKHLNHSKAFWDLVGKWMPDYESCRVWLKRKGGSLMMAKEVSGAE